MEEKDTGNVKEVMMLFLDKRIHPLMLLVVFKGMNVATQASVFINFWVFMISQSKDKDGN